MMEECNYNIADPLAADPFDEFAKKEKESESIYNYLPPLTERQHQILYLYWEGYSKTEIAFILGLTEGTVRTTLNRIFDKI